MIFNEKFKYYLDNFDELKLIDENQFKESLLISSEILFPLIIEKNGSYILYHKENIELKTGFNSPVFLTKYEWESNNIFYNEESRDPFIAYFKATKVVSGIEIQLKSKFPEISFCILLNIQHDEVITCFKVWFWALRKGVKNIIDYNSFDKDGVDNDTATMIKFVS